MAVDTTTGRSRALLWWVPVARNPADCAPADGDSTKSFADYLEEFGDGEISVRSVRASSVAL
jgi:hypothetical protein